MEKAEIISKIDLDISSEEFNEIKIEVLTRLLLNDIEPSNENFSEMFWKVAREWGGFHL